jgi:hypothetical protein
MFKGGGSAGGGKKGSNLEYIKPSPKFIHQFRMQVVNKQNRDNGSNPPKQLNLYQFRCSIQKMKRRWQKRWK